MDKSFLVLATQNVSEQQGTYPLSEAQQDRFMFKLAVVNYFAVQNSKVDRTAKIDSIYQQMRK